MKYQDRFEEIDELGNVSMGRFMLSEVLTRMKITCKECMRDRMRCTLRPKCPDRIFLNILITLGAPKSDFPTFCYQVHIRALESYLKGKAQRAHPHEPRYPLGYFKKFITFKEDDPKANLQAFIAYLKKMTQSPVHHYELGDKWYFSVGNGIFIVDLRRQLVSLDPDGDIVRRPALEPLITFLAGIQKLNVEILKDMQDTWYLRLICPQLDKEQLAQVKPDLKKIEDYWSYIRIYNTANATQVLIGLDPPPKHVIRLYKLRETVEILAKIAQISPKTETQSRAVKEKSATALEPVAPAKH
jgi:hypothetical protein